MAASKKDKQDKLRRALAKVRKARTALQSEAKRIKRHGTQKDKKLVSGLLRELDNTEVLLTTTRELAKKGPKFLGGRELKIRGFWDRYPKSEQKKRAEKFKQFPKQFRGGPTAFDLLLRDYLKFTPRQRKRLQLRVSYGVSHETGKIFSPSDVARMGLSANLSLDRAEAILGLRAVLARAGTVYDAQAWGTSLEEYENDDVEYMDPDEDASVPLGIEWWLV